MRPVSRDALSKHRSGDDPAERPAPVPSEAGTPAPAGPDRFASIPRTDMVATVLKSLKDSILAGGFGADGFLPSEGELAQQFGVSRTVVREAMRGLRAFGLVTVSQGRAPRVKPADPQVAIASLTTWLQRGGATLMHLVEARRPLESETAVLAAERAQPEHVAKLEAAMAELRVAPTLEQQIEADSRFHRALAEAAGNPIFGLLYDTLSGLHRESRLHTISRSGVDIVVRHHGAILEAVRRRDASAARQAMLEHLRVAESDLRDDLARSVRRPMARKPKHT